MSESSPPSRKLPEEFASLLPMAVIMDIIGLPAEDRDQLKAWSDLAIALLSGTSTSEQMASHAMGALSMFHDLQAQFEEARRNPKDDLLGLLAEATGAGDEALSVEECVRLESPFQGHFRKTNEATELAGVDLDRPNLKAQLGFGHGIHLCIGAQLARLGAKVALEELLKRSTQFEVTGPVRQVSSVFVRTAVDVPIRVRG